MGIPLETHSNYYWERAISKVGHAEIIIIIFQSWEAGPSEGSGSKRFSVNRLYSGFTLCCRNLYNLRHDHELKG